jgi:tetratricopeptide (TPR) repeat protein
MPKFCKPEIFFFGGACIRSYSSTVTLSAMQTRLPSQRSLGAIVLIFAWSLIQAGAAASGEATPAPEISKSDRFTTLRPSLPWKMALQPHIGDGKLDEQIRKSQNAVRTFPEPRPHLERLGWLFVAKARASHDPGFYKLAECCAQLLEADDAKSAEALLLRGHVAQSLHRFKEAETAARALVARREMAFDHGLLGDALCDQGKLTEAIQEYQRMVDLRPDLQSYTRVAHARWLKGDLIGAIEVAELAVSAGTAVEAESTAWAWTRLAFYQFQAGEFRKAEAASQAAADLVKDYPPALLLRGRMWLTAGKQNEAVDILRRAAQQNPLPEYQWVLAEALREAGRSNEAGIVEADIKRRGVVSDPRTLSLFLGTRGEQGILALHLAERECADRVDVFTQDALAWALVASGRPAEAWSSMERALAEGTEDARLFLHASVIAVRLGRPDAESWLTRTRALKHLLLPSECRELDASFQRWRRNQLSGSSVRASAP